VLSDERMQFWFLYLPMKNTVLKFYSIQEKDAISLLPNQKGQIFTTNSDHGSYFYYSIIFLQWCCKRTYLKGKRKREQEEELTNMSREICRGRSDSRLPAKRAAGLLSKLAGTAVAARPEIPILLGSCHQWKLWSKYRNFYQYDGKYRKGDRGLWL
jgi:hypothetical protein